MASMVSRRENTVEGCEEAKRDALEAWKYLYEHPDASGKDDLPAEIKEKIKDDWCKCPLCDIFFKPFASRPCYGCPLEEETKAKTYCPLYERYLEAVDNGGRAEELGYTDLSEYKAEIASAAKAIYNRILAWDTSVEE